MEPSRRFFLLLPSFAFIGGIALCGSGHAVRQQASTLTRAQFEADFDTLWQEVEDNYAYLDKKQTDWNKVRLKYRPMLASVTTKKEFVGILERTLEELYDFHCGLNTNTPESPVLVPTSADIWAEWRGSRAVVVEVRLGTKAETEGLSAGDEVVSVDGVDIRAAVEARLPSCLKRMDKEARNWALLTLLAGRHNQLRRIKVRSSDAYRTLELTPREPQRSPTLLEARTLPHHPQVGYIRIHNSLGETDLIKAFDVALAKLRDTRSLILDLRDTPSGGNSVVARGMMGRLISKASFYQRHEVPSDERLYGVPRRWFEQVLPRGPWRYSKPVAVLVDHWTGSMGEGIAIGLDAMHRATVVGTKMARLRGATWGIRLENSGIGVQFPGERLFHINGTPREDFVPPIEVPLTKGHSGKDPILNAGLRALPR